jgi:hypothetical protein
VEVNFPVGFDYYPGWMRIDNAGGVVLAIVYRYEASGVNDLILNKHVETTMTFTHVLAH